MLEDRVILKEDRVFMVSDTHGDIPASNLAGHGLYRSDTRFLSTFDLCLGGHRPILLDHSVNRAHVATFQLVNPPISTVDGSGIEQQSVSLRSRSAATSPPRRARSSTPPPRPGCASPMRA